MIRFGSGPKATSIMTCEIATFTETSIPRTDHSPSSRLCASTCCPASSNAPSTALRAVSAEISLLVGCAATSGSTATAVAVPVTILPDSAGPSVAEAGTPPPKPGCTSAFGSRLRLRSASNGDGRENGEAAGAREDAGSASAIAREPALLRAGAAGRDVVPPDLAGEPAALPLPASPLNSSSSGSRRCACTSFSNPSSSKKRCSCL